MIRILLVVVMLWLSSGVCFANIYTEDPERGWFWYETLPDETDDKKVEKTAEVKSPAVVVFSEPKTMEEAQEKLKLFKERAIMEQSEESIVAYIQMQNWIHEKSESFSKKWQQVLWKNPDLDYSQKNPTSSRAVLVKREEDIKESKNKLQAISDDYGLFFVFRSDCPFCHKMAPIVKSFASKYDFSVFPISQDGVGLPEYPNPRADNGLSKKMNITRVPALFLVNPKRRDIIPISFGLLSHSELTQRLISITDKLGVTQ